MAREIINIPEKTWTPVAIAATNGTIRQPINAGAFAFSYTIRDTGDAAPAVDGDAGKALPLFENGRNEEINNSGPGIDVYIWAKNQDGDSIDNVNIIVDL